MPTPTRDPREGEGGAHPAAKVARALLQFGCRDTNIAELQARAASAGWKLIVTDPSCGSGRFLLTRWGMAREFDTIDDVQNFFKQAGVRHG